VNQEIKNNFYNKKGLDPEISSPTAEIVILYLLKGFSYKLSLKNKNNRYIQEFSIELIS